MRNKAFPAINAFAHEILLTAKQRLEAGGWRVAHGIVDSIWVTPDLDVDDEDHEALEALATDITETVEIRRLEHEVHYDWVAFVPQRESDAGALTKYFGKVAGDDGFKIRGIVARQRSMPPFIDEIQRSCLERFDATGRQRRYSIVSSTRSSAFTPGRCRSSDSSNGTVSPSHPTDTARTCRTWRP